MIIKDITINTEEELKEFKNQCQDYVKRISSLYNLYDGTFIFKYEIQDLPIPFKGNVTISIKSDDKFIFAIVPNKTSGNNVVMAFYKLNDKEVELVHCEDTASEICMPENVMDDEGKEYKVTKIRVSAFNQCDSFEDIKIPQSVTGIGDYAFENCKKLKSINIPKSVTKIGSGTFKECASLESIEIPDSVTEIGYFAFEGCTILKSVKIPNSVTEIGGDAFRGCESLETIEIPDSVTKIGDHAFESCKNLKSIKIPQSATKIGSYAFRECESLKSIEIPNSVTKIGGGAFFYCKSLESIEIPDSVTEIGYFAFEGCTILKSVKIPNSVTEIGGDAFKGCESLETIEIPDSVTKIGDYAFDSCKNLKSIKIPQSATKIGSYAFRECESLKSIEIPNSVTKIGGGAFFYCKNLESVEIPDSVKTIGRAAFYYCKNLQSVEIPESVTEIGASAFEGCESLETIEIPDSVTKIGDSAFKKCKSLKEINIPDSVTEIGASAFEGCESLEAINIPNSVKTIGKAAFLNCKNLKSVEIPNSVMKIGDSTFFSCKSLESIEIPYSVKTIGRAAFYYCKNLESVEIPDSVTKIGDAAFFLCINLKEINIPDSVTEIGDSAFRFCDDLKNVTFSSTISISKIGNSTFQDCNSLEEIKLPNSVTKIGSAFQGCKNLKSINIPDSVTEIGDSAFQGCKSLSSINIPGSVTEIGDSAFQGCMNLKSINIPGSVTEIGDSAFQGCKNLESIEIPDSVTKIGDSAFKKCKSLKEINIPDSVTEIGDSAFRFCDDLKNVTFSSTISISKIGNSTFQDCNSLEEIKLPNSVTIIGDSAFENCGNFNEFHFPDSLVQIGLGAFRNCRFNFLKLPNTLTRIGMGAFCRCLHPDLSTFSLTESDRKFIQYDPSWASTTEDNVRKLYATAQRAFIQSVFLRNKQHNIGSHVAAKCSNLEFVRNLLTKSDKDYEPLFEGELNPALIIDAENQLAELNLYNFQRDSYCTDLASGTPGNCEYISIRDMLASLDKNRLLLNLISGYVGVFKYHFEIYFEEEDTCATIDDTRLNWPVAIPNGQIGCHAFYNIIENIIRNTAKYAFRTGTDKDVAICIRFRTESSYESSKQQLDNDLYFVEIYSNIDQRDICRLVAKQNEYIDLPIIERVTMDSRSEAKGMVEMKASATYLQGKDIVNLEDGAYIHIGHSTPSDYQGHQSALDKYGNPIQLKAFALAAETTDSDKTSSESNFPEYKLSNSTKKEKKYHYLSEGEQTIHQGFLGYRFFMLKPKKVLFVGDNATTTKLLQNVRYELSNWESSIMNPEGIKDKDTLIQKTHFVKKALKNHLSYGTSGELDIFIRDLRDPNGYHPLCWREQLVKDLKKALGERYDSESFFPEIVETLCNNGYGIDFWTSDQLEQHIKDKKNVAYEIMVCGDTHLVSKHKSRLPKRIICQTPADFFCEFKNSCSKSLSDVEGVLPEIEGFAWKKYTESKSYKYDAFTIDDPSKPSFLNHCDKKCIFDKAEYIEALSSAAQQKLPLWAELSTRCIRHQKKAPCLATYINNALGKSIIKNRILESINTRVFMLDENLQSTAKSTFPFGDTERSLLTHLKKCQILFPDCDLSEISPSDFLEIMRDIKRNGKSYDFIFFHYGLLERMFEQMDQNELKELQTMYPGIGIDNSNKKALMVEYLTLLAKEHDVVVKSGRGVPESLPSTVRFVHQISVDQALVEIKSKYLFSNLLYSSRSK